MTISVRLTCNGGRGGQPCPAYVATALEGSGTWMVSGGLWCVESDWLRIPEGWTLLPDGTALCPEHAMRQPMPGLR